MVNVNVTNSHPECIPIMSTDNVRMYIKRRCKKESDRAVEPVTSRVLERLAKQDPATGAIFDQHRRHLDEELTHRTGQLLADQVIRADIGEAARRDNAARMATMEAEYKSDVKCAKYMAGAATLLSFGTFVTIFAYAAGVGAAGSPQNQQ